MCHHSHGFCWSTSNTNASADESKSATKPVTPFAFATSVPANNKKRFIDAHAC
jgi:hypothetical protein